MEKRQDYFRGEILLKGDRAVMSEGCKQLILQDVTEKMQEFFAISSTPEMTVERVEKELLITIRFRAESLKKFNVLRKKRDFSKLVDKMLRLFYNRIN